MAKRKISVLIALALAVVFCSSVFPAVTFAEPEAAPDYTDLTDFENALRGRKAQLTPPVLYLNGDENAMKIWDLSRYDFIPTVEKPKDYKPEPPGTINKSLWRQAQLNKIDGLFEVTKGVYQIRGYDLANMTIIEGKSGVTVIDCLSTTEGAEAALKLYGDYKGKEVNVTGVIITHSHVDHFGGVEGVLKYGKNPDIFAPAGFLEAAILENAFVGDAMSRRSTFMYGTLLPPGETGQVDAGLGKATANGTMALVAPTVTITEENSKQTIDGLEYEFMLFPGTEAPAEMTIYIPSKRLLQAAEISTHTLHNILTPRGAEVRDVRAWWKALDELLFEYGDKTDVICASHHWPTWGMENSRTLLAEQRDAYKFLHDQTVRLINKGYTMTEISAEFEKPGFLPDFMVKEWYNHGYYGTVSHDVRAIYQKYIGWYDMNPSNLNPLPPEELAAEYVKAMGGQKAVRELIVKALETDGGLRWGAEIGKQLVFNDPTEENRELLAKVYEKLGYESEAATWRNMYLVGAAELRKDGPLRLMQRSTVSPATVTAMDDELLYDFIAGRFISEKARGFGFAMDIRQTDRNVTHRVECSGDGVLNFHVINDSASPALKAVAGTVGVVRQYNVLELDRETFVKLILKTDGYTLQEAVKEGKAKVTLGDMVDDPESIEYVNTLFELTEVATPNFNIVQP